MHIYTIHEHGETPAGERDPHAKFIREGFSVPALIFSVAWFLYHRMWRDAMLLAVVIFLVMVVITGGDLSDILGNTLRGVISLAVACFAQDMRRADLARRGYREVGVASGGNAEEAALEYLLRPAPVGTDAGPATAPEKLRVGEDDDKDLISEQ
jgi:hypothetical protein